MRAVLFDLDGTLLDLDLQGFLGRYFKALEAAAAPLGKLVTGKTSVMEAIRGATHAMMLPHPGTTNQAVFYDAFQAGCGIDLGEHWHVFESFYADVFPTLGDSAAPAKGARRALATARELGLQVAIATNPIFPRTAIEHRLDWAGLRDVPVDLITSYENMDACKPLPDYFLDIARRLGVEPTECLMVGDDRVLDLAAADVGMRTFYVGPDEDAYADARGDLDDLADGLPMLV